ncbi:MAG: fluoride efflux transporter CrcB [Chloroflexota bacterium]|nr:fluoride efflux transporter CrcB [Chloroflexota bacterium]
MEIVWVAVGGMAGAVSRHCVSRLAVERWGAELPFGTFVVNMTGSFAIGLLLTALLGRDVDPAWRLLLVTGFLGGYTTFSAYSFELVGLLTSGRLGWAAAYLVASNLLGVMACLAGIACARPFAR